MLSVKSETSALELILLISFIEPIFRLIKPCAVVVTLCVSLNTFVPVALPCKLSISTDFASLAIIVPLASLKRLDT